MTLNELFENSTTTSAMMAPVVQPLGLISRISRNKQPAKYANTSMPNMLGIEPQTPRKKRAK